MDKIAVVILNWNGCEMLRSFLPSVVRFSEADGAVVYVADNGSTDASVDFSTGKVVVNSPLRRSKRARSLPSA